MNNIKSNIEYKENMELKEFTTLKIGGEAKIAYFPKSEQEFIEVLDSLNEKPIIIGNGSNLLISSNGTDKPVVITKNFKTIEIIDETKIKIQAGVQSPVFAKFALENSLEGGAFLIGIPGTVGGAITMNSSAHGDKVEDIFIRACIYDFENKKSIILNKEEMQFAYRTSAITLNPNYILLWAEFELKKASKETIQERMDFHVDYRAKNHPPLTMPSCGSTFKNPERGVPVGKMLEDLGAKTWENNDAKVSIKHANFVINTNNASSMDMLSLMLKMHNEVKSSYGYEVHTEVKFIGNKDKKEEEIWQVLKG